MKATPQKKATMFRLNTDLIDKLIENIDIILHFKKSYYYNKWIEYKTN